MIKVLSTIAIIIIAVGLVFFWLNSYIYNAKQADPNQPINTNSNVSPDRPTEEPESREILLYYYNPEQDMDPTGNIMCSRDGLVSLSRTIPVSQTPIQDVIRLLLLGDLTEAEKAQGITTEFPLADVTLVGANLREGLLTLEFSDPLNRTSGGSCRAGILWLQIEATAKQFSEVEQVQFIPEELFQP